MGNAPGIALSRITDVTQAWGSLRPTKSFSGLTLEQFKEEVKPSLDARAELAELEGRVQAALARRDAADASSAVAVRRVVNAVKGDGEEGEDGELYAAMCFVRKSTRSSGLTRKRAKDETAPAA